MDIFFEVITSDESFCNVWVKFLVALARGTESVAHFGETAHEFEPQLVDADGDDVDADGVGDDRLLDEFSVGGGRNTYHLAGGSPSTPAGLRLASTASSFGTSHASATDDSIRSRRGLLDDEQLAVDELLLLLLDDQFSAPFGGSSGNAAHQADGALLTFSRPRLPSNSSFGWPLASAATDDRMRSRRELEATLDDVDALGASAGAAGGVPSRRFFSAGGAAADASVLGAATAAWLWFENVDSISWISIMWSPSRIVRFRGALPDRKSFT